jgi:hypothetical protein
MSFIVEHKIGGRKVRQLFAYRYPETLEVALRGLDVVKVFLEDGKTRVFWNPCEKANASSPGK